ncbi:Anti-sigma regulatory factor (Ser/Thr protein kinase) [Streptomyces sp. 1331.2]|nr:Anti-sigma regulatory factor (Ser/Thr protein kinase) [Streptomyces sp. 1331.2]
MTVTRATPQRHPRTPAAARFPHPVRATTATAVAEPTTPASATAFLPYKPESVSEARRLVRDKLTEWGLSSLVDSAELIVSELATNAVKTGCQLRMGVAVRLMTDEVVRILVRDGSRSLPVLITAGSDAPSGRGIHLVHSLTGGHWGVTPEPLGKTVHADLRIRPRRDRPTPKTPPDVTL